MRVTCPRCFPALNHNLNQIAFKEVAKDYDYDYEYDYEHSSVLSDQLSVPFIVVVGREPAIKNGAMTSFAFSF